MGRMNRSRKRSDEMKRVKKTRNAAKELIRLKKTLGLIDADGNEIMKEVEDVVTVKTAQDIQLEKLSKEERQVAYELEDEQDKGEEIKVVNEKTGKEHIYNTKTLRDQHGSYPAWYKPRKTAKKQRKLDHARKMKFKQKWTTTNVPL